MDDCVLSIVIVTYMSDKYIYDCLDSIIKYNDLGDKLKIVVVDNSPLNHSMLENCMKIYSNVLFVRNSENTGFGAGNNIGARIIDSEFILFLNADTELVSPIFSEIIVRFRRNSILGCLGIKQIGGGLSFFQRIESSISSGELKRAIRENKYSSSVHFLSGSFLFFRRSAFEQCGRFDENIFMYFEEQDILRRLSISGFESEFDSSLFFIHKVGNRKKGEEILWNIGSQSFCYYLSKYDLPNKKRLLAKRRNIFLKRLIYFLFKMNFKEVLKFARVLRYERLLFIKSFCN